MAESDITTKKVKRKKTYSFAVFCREQFNEASLSKNLLLEWEMYSA